VKYAKVSGSLRWSGGTTILSAGITTADDDHPLVVERPDLWTDQAPTASLAGPGGGKHVGPPAPDPRDARITELEAALAERDAQLAKLAEAENSEEEPAAPEAPAESAPIERATRAPGERRPTSRPRGDRQ
jgi:hypothetical protein